MDTGRPEADTERSDARSGTGANDAAIATKVVTTDDSRSISEQARAYAVPTLQDRPQTKDSKQTFVEAAPMRCLRSTGLWRHWRLQTDFASKELSRRALCR
jgi:hypothetical protein